jgi:hypothetical protein
MIFEFLSMVFWDLNLGCLGFLRVAFSRVGLSGVIWRCKERVDGSLDKGRVQRVGWLQGMWSFVAGQQK